MIRTILLDLDNTLIDRQTALESYNIAWLAGYGVLLGANPEARLFLIEAQRFDNFGYTSRDEYNAWWCEEVRERFDIACSPETFWRAFQDNFAEYVRPFEEVLDTLADLSDRFNLALVSNGGGDNQRAKLDHAGLTDFFDPDAVLISAEVGSWKPDLDIFQEALDRMESEADEVLFVGDDPTRDILPARQIGMKTGWVSLGRHFPAKQHVPDLFINSFTDIKSWLDAEGHAS